MLADRFVYGIPRFGQCKATSILPPHADLGMNANVRFGPTFAPLHENAWRQPSKLFCSDLVLPCVHCALSIISPVWTLTLQRYKSLVPA